MLNLMMIQLGRWYYVVQKQGKNMCLNTVMKQLLT